MGRRYSGDCRLPSAPRHPLQWLAARRSTVKRRTCSATYRPDYTPPWIDTSHFAQILLPSLTPRESLTLVRSVARPEELPDRLIQAILRKAEGNPFFRFDRSIGSYAKSVSPEASAWLTRAS